MPTIATISPRLDIAPRRSLERLLDGIRSWLDGPAGEGAPAWAEVEGGAAGETAFLLAAFESVAPALGLRAFACRFRNEWFPRGLAEVAARLLLEKGDFEPEEDPLLSLRNSGTGLTVPGSWILSAKAARLELLDRASRFLLEEAGTGPAVLWFDGVEEADSLSRDCLAVLLRRLAGNAGRPRPLLVVLAGGRRGLLSLRAEPRTEPLFSLRLTAHSGDEIGRLARLRLGTDLPLSERECLRRLTGGRPRELRRLLGAWARAGATERRRIPAASERLFELLPGDARRLLLLCAARGEPATAGELMDIWECRQGGGSAFPAALLDQLAADGWIECIADAGGPRYALDGATRAPVLKRWGDKAAAEARFFWAGRLLSHFRSSRRPLWALAGGFRCLVEALGRGPVPEEAGLPAEPAGLISFAWDLAVEVEEALSSLGCFEEAAAALELFLEALEACSAPGDLARETSRRIAGLLERMGCDREALLYYRRSREGRQSTERLVDLWCRAAECASRCGELEEEEASLSEARRLAALSANPEAAGRAALACARAALRRRRPKECLAYLGECERGEVEENQRRVLEREAHAALGDLPKALEAAERAAGLAEEYGLLDECVASRARLGGLLAVAGDLRAAEAELSRSMRLALESGSRYLEVEPLKELARVASEYRRYPEARDRLLEARRILEELGLKEEMALIDRRLAGIDLRLGRFEEAASTIAWLLGAELAAVESGTGSGREPALVPDTLKYENDRLRELASLSARGRAEPDELTECLRLLVRRGDVVAARAELARAEARALSHSAEIARLKARLTWLEGDLGTALGSYETALCELAKGGGRGGALARVLAECYRAVGLLLLERGRPGRALDYAARSLEIELERGDLRGLVQSVNAVAQLLVWGGMRAAACECARAAVETARRAGWVREEVEALCVIAEAGCAEGRTADAESALARIDRLCALDIGPLWDVRRLLEHGRLALLACRTDEAWKALRQAVEQCRAFGLGTLLADALLLLGRVEACPGNPNGSFLKALETFEAALRASRRQGRPKVSWEALQGLRALYEWKGKPAPARVYAERALELAEATLGRVSELGFRWTEPAGAAVGPGPLED